jgi:hypothetical protein
MVSSTRILAKNDTFTKTAAGVLLKSPVSLAENTAGFSKKQIVQTKNLGFLLGSAFVG